MPNVCNVHQGMDKISHTQANVVAIRCYIKFYISIAIALDESIFLDVLYFPMKKHKSHDLDVISMDGATSNPASDVVCLLLLS